MSFSVPERHADTRFVLRRSGRLEPYAYHFHGSASGNMLLVDSRAIYGSGGASAELSRKHHCDDDYGWIGPSKRPRAAAVTAAWDDSGVLRRTASIVSSYAPSTSTSFASFQRIQPRLRESSDDPDHKRQERSEGDTLVFMSREEIERCSPSRKDGIDRLRETYLRYSYCWYLQSLGMRLQLPQITIATAVVYCHRFFVRRSHAGNDRYLIATAALFLATKTEESPCLLNSVLRASYELCKEQDLAFFPCFRHGKDWFDQYRERVIAAENMILTTLDFEVDVEHPYASLTSALEKLGLSQTMLMTLARNLISEGLRSSLWLQFKPHHIAAGAVFLAAKFLHIDLSCYQSIWLEFQISSSSTIQEIVQQLMELF